MASRRSKRLKKANFETSNLKNDQTLAKLDSLTKKAKIEKKSDQFSSKKKFSQPTLIGGVIAVIVIGSLFGLFLFNGAGGGNLLNTGNNNLDQILGFPETCLDSHSRVELHYHWTLSLYVDDNIRNIPASIGQNDGCIMRQMHTHQADSTIHVEVTKAYQNYQPTVAEFFTIWQKSNSFATLTNTELLNTIGNITSSVNNQLYTGSILSYSPRDRDSVQINLSTQF